jgi:hypothetical protein
MMRKLFNIPFYFALVLFFLVSTGQAQSKKLASKNVRCPDEAPTIGWYRNYSYGFSITIPQNLKGYWNSVPCAKDQNDCVCLGDHGRFITIRKEAYLEVFVSVWTSETSKESMVDEQSFILENHKGKGENTETLNLTGARLDRVPSTRLKLRYKEAKTGMVMVEDSIFCAPMDKEHEGWLYKIHLVTPETRYGKDKLLLDRVIKSWRFRSRL